MKSFRGCPGRAHRGLGVIRWARVGRAAPQQSGAAAQRRTGRPEKFAARGIRTAEGKFVGPDGCGEQARGGANEVQHRRARARIHGKYKAAVGVILYRQGSWPQHLVVSPSRSACRTAPQATHVGRHRRSSARQFALRQPLHDALALILAKLDADGAPPCLAGHCQGGSASHEAIHHQSA